MSFRFETSTISFACALLLVWPSVDRRIVDSVDAGDAISEVDHGFVGIDDSAGHVGGKSYRQGHSMRYALKTFEDTEVTVECTFVALPVDSAPRRYEIVVEDSVIASRVFSLTSVGGSAAVSSSAPTVVEFAVPFVLTKGKNNIAITLRSAGGLTPALRQLRTVQNHNELQQ